MQGHNESYKVSLADMEKYEKMKLSHALSLHLHHVVSAFAAVPSGICASLLDVVSAVLHFGSCSVVSQRCSEISAPLFTHLSDGLSTTGSELL